MNNSKLFRDTHRQWEHRHRAQSQGSRNSRSSRASSSNQLDKRFHLGFFLLFFYFDIIDERFHLGCNHHRSSSEAGPGLSTVPGSLSLRSSQGVGGSRQLVLPVMLELLYVVKDLYVL